MQGDEAAVECQVGLDDLDELPEVRQLRQALEGDFDGRGVLAAEPVEVVHRAVLEQTADAVEVDRVVLGDRGDDGAAVPVVADDSLVTQRPDRLAHRVAQDPERLRQLDLAQRGPRGAGSRRARVRGAPRPAARGC